MRDRYDQIIRNIIQRGMDLGLFPELNKKLAGFMIASMITRSRLWYHPNKGVSISDLIEFIVNFSLYGLAGTKQA
jgi:hypothetical protein